MTLDPLPYVHRPLALYVATNLFETAGAVVYHCFGFQKLRYHGISYWFKLGSVVSRGPALLFFHGICAGWMGYISLITNIGAGKSIILVDYNAIKVLSLNFEVCTTERYTLVVKKILERHKISKVYVAGHSFGSITAGWFMKQYPNMVIQLILIDPVSLLLGFPDVAHAFLHRSPSTLVEWGIHLFASSDITVSHTMYRNFWWYQNVLWLEDVPSSIPVIIGLAGRDEILNPAAVFEYINLCKKEKPEALVDTLFWPKFSHAQILFDVPAQKSLAECMKRSERP